MAGATLSNSRLVNPNQSSTGGVVTSQTPQTMSSGGGVTTGTPSTSPGGIPAATPTSNVYGQAPAGWEYNYSNPQGPPHMDRSGAGAGQRTADYLNTAFPGLYDAVLKGLGSAFNPSLGGFGAGGGAGAAGPYTAPIQMGDPTAANNAQFATAKDKVGEQARSALSSLRDELGSTGMLGSGSEAQGVRDIIAGGQGQLGQVSRDLAVQNANTANDFAKTNFGGAITQRGQDVDYATAQAQIAAANRRSYLELLGSALRGLGGPFASALGSASGSASSALY